MTRSHVTALIIAACMAVTASLCQRAACASADASGMTTPVPAGGYPEAFASDLVLTGSVPPICPVCSWVYSVPDQAWRLKYAHGRSTISPCDHENIGRSVPMVRCPACRREVMAGAAHQRKDRQTGRFVMCEDGDGYADPLDRRGFLDRREDMPPRPAATAEATTVPVAGDVL